jgi:hypothetical protein
LKTMYAQEPEHIREQIEMAEKEGK